MRSHHEPSAIAPSPTGAALQAPRPPGDDGEVRVVQKAGCMVGQRGGEFVVTEKKETLQKFPLNQVRSIYLYGAVQLTTQAAHACLEHGIDVAYFSPAGRFLGLLRRRGFVGPNSGWCLTPAHVFSEKCRWLCAECVAHFHELGVLFGPVEFALAVVF